jgi:hypothetical protein
MKSGSRPKRLFVSQTTEVLVEPSAAQLGKLNKEFETWKEAPPLKTLDRLLVCSFIKMQLLIYAG